MLQHFARTVSPTIRNRSINWSEVLWDIHRSRVCIIDAQRVLQIEKLACTMMNSSEQNTILTRVCHYFRTVLDFQCIN